MAGGITGVLLAVIYRRQGPQKPVKEWEDDDENEEDEAEYQDNDPELNEENLSEN